MLIKTSETVIIVLEDLLKECSGGGKLRELIQKKIEELKKSNKI